MERLVHVKNVNVVKHGVILVVFTMILVASHMLIGLQYVVVDVDAQMVCKAEHTLYDPTQEEFVCPKCKAKCGIFCVDSTPMDADTNCTRLHTDDELHCGACNYSTMGLEFAELFR